MIPHSNSDIITAPKTIYYLKNKTADTLIAFRNYDRWNRKEKYDKGASLTQMGARAFLLDFIKKTLLTKRLIPCTSWSNNGEPLRFFIRGNKVEVDETSRHKTLLILLTTDLFIWNSITIKEKAFLTIKIFKISALLSFRCALQRIFMSDPGELLINRIQDGFYNAKWLGFYWISKHLRFMIYNAKYCLSEVYVDLI